MSRILFAAIAALAVLQRSLKLSMAADAAGITTDDAACRRTNRGTGRDATGRLHVTTSRPGRSCGLISAAGETRRNTPRQIRPIRPGTTARRISRFRTAYVSRTEGARRFGRERDVTPPLARQRAG
jgi:hypothetical protein